eukprot:12773891-Alexandrium_andersonii.AAC.1
MGSDEFGPLPSDLVDQPFSEHGTVFPPRPPLEPIASILDTGALAAEQMAEPPLPPMAEAAGVADLE